MHIIAFDGFLSARFNEILIAKKGEYYTILSSAKWGDYYIILSSVKWGGQWIFKCQMGRFNGFLSAKWGDFNEFLSAK